MHKALPRMGHSEQTMVSGAHNGWVTVRDELCDRDPSVLQRLAKELSYTSGGVVLALGVEDGALVRYTLYDRGAAVDEYASRAGVPRAAAARRRDRARREPDGRRAPDRRRAGARARDRAHGVVAGRPAAGARAARADRRADGRAGLMLTLYDAARCPYCARVRIVLAEKGVEYEPIEIDLTDRPAWIYEKNATGRVPVRRGGRLAPAGVRGDHGVPRGALSRSRRCSPPTPPTARSRGCGSSGTTTSRSRTTRCAAARTARPRASTPSSASSTLRSAQRPWLGGSEYGLADIAYVPWVLRARDMLGVSLDGFPAVAAWLERLAERPSIAMEADVVAAL